MKKMWPALGRVALLLAVCDQLLITRAADAPDRTILFPRFVAGQTIAYDVGYRVNNTSNTESNVAAPMAPAGGQIAAHLTLQVQALEIGSDLAKPSVHLRTQLFDAAASSSANSPSPDASSPIKIVEFTLHSNGQLTDLSGLEALSPSEKAAWQEWVQRFGVGAAIPEKGVKPGEKWHTEEPILNALLTGLSWDKESQYVDNEPCGVGVVSDAQIQPSSASLAGAQEPCAVILTTAILRQKNPQKDSTPDDYKLHDLRTYGIAGGRNEVISYISLRTGIVMRVSEDASQSLNVIVAKTDGSNRVHYIVDAQSHAQIRLTKAPTSTN